MFLIKRKKREKRKLIARDKYCGELGWKSCSRVERRSREDVLIFPPDFLSLALHATQNQEGNGNCSSTQSEGKKHTQKC